MQNALFSLLKILFGLYRDSLKKTLDRVCKTPEVTGDRVSFPQISISAANRINPVLFSKLKTKTGNYLISGPIRNEINEFYFN